MDRDSQLIKGHLAGDTQASQQLIERHQDRVYGLAWRLLGSAEEAREAAQDTFLQALAALPRFRGEAAFSTWLYRIAVNACNARRQKHRTDHVSLDGGDQAVAAAAKTPSSLDLLVRHERHQRLHRAIDQLGDQYRTAVVLHYFQDLSYEETARAMDLPIGTVKVRLHRAKRLLLNKLQSRRQDL